MNANEFRTAIRNSAVDKLLEISDDLLIVDDSPYTFILPVDVDGETYYAQIGITSKTAVATAKSDKYSPEGLCSPAKAYVEKLRRLEKELKEKEKKG